MAEILDGDAVPDELAKRAYGELARIHRWLGDTGFVIRSIREDPLPVRSILDIGCATGEVLLDVHRKLGVEAVGIDLYPRRAISAPIPTVQADATHDTLPYAAVAFSMYLGHHLSQCDLICLIQNVGRFCRRFILLELVRHPLPLALFRLFVAPFVSRLVIADGQASIRRSYTSAELVRIARAALEGTGARFRHSVSPCYSRQVLDISYSHSRRDEALCPECQPVPPKRFLFAPEARLMLSFWAIQWNDANLAIRQLVWKS